MTTATAAVPDHAPSSIERWYVLIIMCLGYAINIADRNVVTLASGRRDPLPNIARHIDSAEGTYRATC